MRAQVKLYEVQPPAIHQPAPVLQGTLQRWLPRKESRLMAEEMQRTNGVFIPYPLLALLMTLALALGGGLIGLYAQVSTMNATMIMRDADRNEQLRKMEEKLELTNMYVRDLREKEVAREAREERRRAN